MSDTKNTASLAFFASVGIIAFIPAYCIWVGFAFSVLWGWFVVPALGLLPLSIANAIGICVIIGLLKYNYSKPAEDGAVTRMVYQTLSPAFSLGVGWIVKTYLA